MSDSPQTLIVWSRDPEMIKAPFGEKWTEVTQSLWAFFFSLFSSRDNASMKQKDV